jgi:hypothetical protein
MAGESTTLNREVEIFGLVQATTSNDLRGLAYAFDSEEGRPPRRVCACRNVCACLCAPAHVTRRSLWRPNERPASRCEAGQTSPVRGRAVRFRCARMWRLQRRRHCQHHSGPCHSHASLQCGAPPLQLLPGGGLLLQGMSEKRLASSQASLHHPEGRA